MEPPNNAIAMLVMFTSRYIPKRSLVPMYLLNSGGYASNKSRYTKDRPETFRHSNW